MKKLMSMVLVLCMLCSTFMVAGATAGETANEVLVYATFDGFTGTRDDKTVPEGFSAFPMSDWYSKNNVAGVDEETKSAVDVLHGQWQGSLVYPMEQVIRTGKLHWGVDAKMQDPTKAMMKFQAISATEDENVYDWFNETANSLNSEVYYLVGNTTDSGATFDGKAYTFPKTYQGAGTEVSGAPLDTEWHHYDFYLDFDKRELKVYCDGVILGTTSEIGSSGIKALALQSYSGNIDYTVSIDNWYVNRYTETETPAILSPATSVQGNGTIEINFTEPLESQVVAADFTIENEAGVTVANGMEDAVPFGTRGALITLPDLSAGKYNLVLTEELSGMISEKQLAPLSFVVSEAIEKTDRYYYINESFDSYEGGLPGGWDGPYNNWSGSEMAAAVTAVEGNSGTALSFYKPSTEKYLKKEFGRSITGGSFTIEFDAYGNKSGLALSLLTEGQTEYGDPRYVSTNNMASWRRSSTEAYATWLTTQTDTTDSADNWNAWLASEESLSIRTNWKADAEYGNMLLCNDESGNIYGASNNIKAWWTSGSAVKTTLAAEENAWNHFEIVVDLDNENYTIYLNDPDRTAGETVAFAARRFSTFNNAYLDTQGGNGIASITVSDITTNFKRYFANGITGIRLGQSAMAVAPTDSVIVDNLQVYTNNSYNLLQDYNNLTKAIYGNDSGAGSLGWYSLYYAGTSTRPGTQQRLAGEEDGDYYIYMLQGNGGKNIMARKLDKPVKAGTPFTVEFKMKTTSDKENSWAFGIGTEDYAMPTNPDRFPSELAPDTNIKGTLGSYQSHQGMTILRNNQYNYSLGKVTGTDLYYHTKLKTAGAGTAAASGGSNIIYKYGEWNYIKLVVEPQTTGVNYTLYFKNTGYSDYVQCQTVTVTDGFDFTTMDADFIYFCLLDKEYIYLDDLKVYENETAEKLTVLDVTTIAANGEKAALGEEYNQNMTGLELTFSGALASADGISLRDPNASTQGQEVNITKALSEDGKTVTVTVNGALTDGKKYLLTVDDVAGADSNISNVDTYTKYFTYNAAAENAGAVEITDAWVEGYYQDASAKDTVTQEGVWVRLGSGVNLTNVQKLKYHIKGYSTGALAKVLAMWGSYNTDSMLQPGCIYFETPQGAIEKESEEISLIEGSTLMKFFTWDYNDCRALIDVIELAVPAADGE